MHFTIKLKMYCILQVWWYVPVIPALGRLRQEDWELAVDKLHSKTESQNILNWGQWLMPVILAT
jgi:hypothetical protein